VKINDEFPCSTSSLIYKFGLLDGFDYNRLVSFIMPKSRRGFASYFISINQTKCSYMKISNYNFEGNYFF
jgi:hypothetical protein